jgi:replicative DNA helicase
MTLKTLSQYGPHFQVKVINSLLKNKKFLLNIRDVIIPSYFENQAHQWLVKETLQYFDEFHSTPTIDFLKIEVKKLDNDVLKTAIVDQLREVYKMVNDDQEYIEQEFQNFCKNQALKSALLQSVDLLQDGMFDDIRFTIDNALKAGQDKNIGHEYLKDVASRYKEEDRQVIPTPWPIINERLMGGLGGGDFGLIFGSPGGGKSWTMVALGAHAVKLGLNVAHYTLELSEGYVGKRYDAHFINQPVNTVHVHQDKVKSYLENLKGSLTIKEYAPGQASITTIEGHVQKMTDLGYPPDMILIDYVDLLKSSSSSKDEKERLDNTYVSTKALARTLNVPVWSVSQVNRAGAKDDVIEGDKAAGSYNKIMITDFCMSLSRLPQDKINGTGRFFLMKNRYGMDGMTYYADVDVSTGHIEMDETPRELPEPSTQPPPAFATEKTEQDRKQLAPLANNFFQNSSIPS